MKQDNSLKNVVEELKSIHVKHEAAFKLSILQQLKEMEPETFEKFSRSLLETYGFTDVKVTQPSKDGGIDGYGKLEIGVNYLNVAFQCKRWKNKNVSRLEIDRFRGTSQGKYELGIIFTTSNFSREATNAMTQSGAVPIALIDGLALIDIMIEKRFGVDYETMPVYINALDRVLTEDI